MLPSLGSMLTYPMLNVETWTHCLTVSLLGANLINSPLRTRNIVSFLQLPPLKAEQVINKGNELGSKHLVLLTIQMRDFTWYEFCSRNI